MAVLSGAFRRLRSVADRSVVSAAKKPPDLIYGVDEVPPFPVVILSGIQHVGLVMVFLIFPLLVLKESGIEDAVSLHVLALAVMALGIASILQALSRGPIGSGFLCPANYSAIYLAPAVAAVKSGGLAVLFGMTVFAGLVEVALSWTIRRIRSLVPPELSGLVIFLVGTTVGSLGFRYLIGVGSERAVGHWDVAVAMITLAVTIALNVWGKGQFRMFCALIGMLIGYGAAIVTGTLSADELNMVTSLPLVAFPAVDHIAWSFEPTLILPFTIAALVAAIKAVAVVTVCQRINDAGWVRPEMPSLSRGVLADGLGTAMSGMLGSMGLNASPTCAGLAATTGVTSRVVGFAVGGLLIALGFLPMLTGLFVMMPRPVMGAVLVFVACSILINGIQAIASRLLDARRTLVIGLAMSGGITAEIAPSLVSELPSAVAPVVSSSLVVGTVIALSLNLIFRLGQRQRVSLIVDALTSDAMKQVGDFVDEQGRAWAARRDVIERVSFGAIQAVEAIQEYCNPQDTIRVDMQFDEFSLEVQFIYRGEPLEFPDRRPSDKDIIETEAGHRRLAGYMLRRNADRVGASRKGDESVIQFQFDH